jgi:hypothetical protein
MLWLRLMPTCKGVQKVRCCATQREPRGAGARVDYWRERLQTTSAPRTLALFLLPLRVLVSSFLAILMASVHLAGYLKIDLPVSPCSVSHICGGRGGGSAAAAVSHRSPRERMRRRALRAIDGC